MANMDVLDGAVTWLREHPDFHDQGVWFYPGREDELPAGAVPGGDGYEYWAEIKEDRTPKCGTTLCVAGEIAFQTAPIGSLITDGMLILPGETIDTAEDVGDYAEKVAGLTKGQADVLFAETDNLADVEVVVEAIRANPDVERDELIHVLGAHKADGRL